MDNINQYVGKQIKMYRKASHMTLQDLADAIHKSRATVSKYENGEITIDIQTLYEIANVLSIHINQLTDYKEEKEVVVTPSLSAEGKSPFFEANRLYFYFYDGRYKRLKGGIIDIRESKDEPGQYDASLYINTNSASGKSSATYYTGKVVYSDMLIRFTFVNQYNALEQDLLYIFNPLEFRDYTEGLLCGISSADLMPCAFKCLVTLTPQEYDVDLQKRLTFTKSEIQRWQKLNMLIVDNRNI